MTVIADQGWNRSAHYSNEQGVVAQCKDCHIPPEPVHKFWAKSRDGIKDVVVHTFGESDPYKMHWDKLTVSARRKISNSSCLKCHKNLTPKGAPIKVIVAHRAFLRLNDDRKCLECHRESFHGEYRNYLSDGEPSKGGNL
jgi:nitrate/TMAO reductase-like tetraheme cytochrome c subunit